MPHIIEKITLQEIRDAEPEAIYCGFRSCWWTHRSADLYLLPGGLPCDPRGGVLMTYTDAQEFLDRAEAHPELYGRNGLEALLAAHHDNCVVSPANHTSTCLRTWDEMNDLLDAQREGDASS